MVDKVIVNEEQCKLVAQRLIPLQFRKEHFKRQFLNFPSDKETKLRTFLFPVAICHQTHNLHSKKLNLWGWEYLEHIYTNLGQFYSQLIDPKYLANLSKEKLIEKIKPLFSDDGNPENCTLDRLEERAGFIIEISKYLNEHYDGKIMNLLLKSNGLLFDNGQGIYELMEHLPAFADSQRKKSTVFIKLVIDANLFEIKDQKNMIPIMDYHMQRVLLRTGCIEVIDNELKEALLQKRTLNSDEEVRNASVEAIRKISRFSNKDISIIHDFFWPLGRSCCKEKTLCADKTCNKKPCTFFNFVDIPEHNQCIFEGICKGGIKETYRKFWQPIVDTHYY
jgi:hypothetical protein